MITVVKCLLWSTADKDKDFLEEKLSASSIALDGLNQQMHGLSLKLASAEETTRIREFPHPFLSFSFPIKIYSVSETRII